MKERSKQQDRVVAWQQDRRGPNQRRIVGIAMVAVAGGGWLAQTAALLRVYPLGGAPRLAALWYPAGCWIVGRLLLTAARDLEQRRPVVWGGKQYVLEPR